MVQTHSWESQKSSAGADGALCCCTATASPLLYCLYRGCQSLELLHVPLRNPTVTLSLLLLPRGEAQLMDVGKQCLTQCRGGNGLCNSVNKSETNLGLLCCYWWGWRGAGWSFHHCSPRKSKAEWPTAGGGCGWHSGCRKKEGEWGKVERRNAIKAGRGQEMMSVWERVEVLWSSFCFSG